jgi:hypothetical protein
MIPQPWRTWRPRPGRSSRARATRWPAAPDPLLLLDGPLRRCCEALGRFAAHPTYFHEVPHVAILPTEASKLKCNRQAVCCHGEASGKFANQSMLIFEATSRLTGEVVHVRAIIQRPKKDAWKFCEDWEQYVTERRASTI